MKKIMTEVILAIGITQCVTGVDASDQEGYTAPKYGIQSPTFSNIFTENSEKNKNQESNQMIPEYLRQSTDSNSMTQPVAIPSHIMILPNAEQTVPKYGIQPPSSSDNTIDICQEFNSQFTDNTKNMQEVITIMIDGKFVDQNPKAKSTETPLPSTPNIHRFSLSEPIFDINNKQEQSNRYSENSEENKNQEFNQMIPEYLLQIVGESTEKDQNIEDLIDQKGEQSGNILYESQSSSPLLRNSTSSSSTFQSQIDSEK